MIKKDLLLPALIGLGMFAQSNELSLCNNTTILLLLFLVIEDHAEIRELECDLEKHQDRCDFRHGCGDHCYSSPMIRRGGRVEVVDDHHHHHDCHDCCNEERGRRRQRCF